jgi:hypothetical protein
MTTVAVQIVDRGIQQYGQISEPVSYKDSIANALAHFGISYGNISWDFRNDNRGIGTVDGTTKIVSYVRTD